MGSDPGDELYEGVTLWRSGTGNSPGSRDGRVVAGRGRIDGSDGRVTARFVFSLDDRSQLAFSPDHDTEGCPQIPHVLGERIDLPLEPFIGLPQTRQGPRTKQPD